MIRIAPLAVLGAMVAGPEVQAAGSSPLTADDRVLLRSYAEATWRSIDKASRDSALPADGIWRAGSSWSSLTYTSPTDIGAYLWSTIAAEGLGLIPHEDASRRLANTLSTVGRLERSHGFFYNWYDPKTGERLRNWPGGGPVRGFLSTVDNAWLAMALMMVGKAHPELKATAENVLQPMDFSFFYDALDPAHPNVHPGLFRGGFFPDGGGVFADFHYGMLNTEPRIASYVGIARGQLPADHYYRMTRATPEPTAPTRTYRGVPVIEAWQPYKGAQLLPSWDGTMFEALMVPLFVPEASWGPSSWGTNHRLYAKAQIEYGLNDAKLGYWGISASTDTHGGYRAFGVAALGAEPDGRARRARRADPRGHAARLVPGAGVHAQGGDGQPQEVDVVLPVGLHAVRVPRRGGRGHGLGIGGDARARPGDDPGGHLQRAGAGRDAAGVLDVGRGGDPPAARGGAVRGQPVVDPHERPWRLMLADQTSADSAKTPAETEPAFRASMMRSSKHPESEPRRRRHDPCARS